MPSSSKLSSVDAAWLRMDSSTNAMVITAALLFEGALDFQAFEQIVRERLLRLPRFTQRVQQGRAPLDPPRWVEDESFDLRNHLHR
ncbi:MAG: wax ester/triacylglycerol synthase family O-acyltransferase, partial [Polyangiaceae bacterium]